MAIEISSCILKEVSKNGGVALNLNYEHKFSPFNSDFIMLSTILFPGGKKVMEKNELVSQL